MARRNTAEDPYTRLWKTGERVAYSGTYIDQYGVVSTHEAPGTFPPTVRTSSRRGGECAFRRLVRMH